MVCCNGINPTRSVLVAATRNSMNRKKLSAAPTESIVVNSVSTSLITITRHTLVITTDEANGDVTLDDDDTEDDDDVSDDDAHMASTSSFS